MAYSFRRYSLDQAYLLPQVPREWLPEGHLPFFLEETVSPLELRSIFDRHQFLRPGSVARPIAIWVVTDFSRRGLILFTRDICEEDASPSVSCP